jgi:hypothetical protein
MFDDILKQIELITNWENECDWLNKPWYSDLLIKNTSTLYKNYLERPLAANVDFEHKEIILGEYRAENQFLDDYWKNINLFIQQVVRQLSGYCSNIILTGSLADGQVVQGWSDIDCVLAIRESTLKNHQSLRDLVAIVRSFKNQFKTIDPLSHHAFFITTECELNAQSFSNLPVGLFANSTAIHGRTKICLKKKISHKEYHAYLRNDIQFLRSCLDEGKMSHHSRSGVPLFLPFQYNQNQMYQLKYLVGRILLLPCAYASSKGFELGKRQSFEFLYDEIPGLDEMRYFEHIRKSYPGYIKTRENQLIPKEIVSSEFSHNLKSLIRKLGE